MSADRLIFTADAASALTAAIARLSPAPDRVAIVCDTTTRRLVVDALRPQCPALADALVLEIAPGEQSKTPAQAVEFCNRMLDAFMTRRSLVVNIGGGVVTDLGGFAASIYMRGIRVVNVPTTLLAAVDASVGGKTGVNLGGVKNAVGTFSNPEAVVISPPLMATLDRRDIMSGYGEMLKHGLLSGDAMLSELLRFDPSTPMADPRWMRMIEESVAVKRDVVSRDFRESGLRKVLNLGHTSAHAIESAAWGLGKSVAHGYAVAWGLVIALVLSRMKLGMPSETLYSVAGYIGSHYGSFPLGCDDYEAMWQAMTHDKKNTGDGAANFTLLKSAGCPVTDVAVGREDVEAAFDIARDLTHA